MVPSFYIKKMKLRILQACSLKHSINMYVFCFGKNALIQVGQRRVLSLLPTLGYAPVVEPYVRNHLSYKLKKQLSIYKSYELQSIFIEINNFEKSNIVIRCIYKHTGMNLNEFNEFYLNNLLDQKTVFLVGDFNINLLNYDQDTSTNEFLNPLPFHLFLPYIHQPTRVTSNSKTLIDNIFSNAISPILYLAISPWLSQITYHNFSSFLTFFLTHQA